MSTHHILEQKRVPRVRLFAYIKVVRELGLERRETVRILSVLFIIEAGFASYERIGKRKPLVEQLCTPTRGLASRWRVDEVRPKRWKCSLRKGGGALDRVTLFKVKVRLK